MAETVLGLWTTHGPTLNTTPAQWTNRVRADLDRKHWFRGEELSFDELVARRAGENLPGKHGEAERRRRHEACQKAIAEIGRQWEAAAPDACVILGNDQRELFLPAVQPAFTVYHGASFYNVPLTDAQRRMLPPGIEEADWAYRPKERTDYPGLPELAAQVFEQAGEDGFDLAASEEWPSHDGHRHAGTPHAFSFVLRRVMRDRAVPTLPVITNTFYPPNQPGARRCYEFGRMIGRALARWNSGARVAVVGSGGMSHFCIDEELDGRFLSALEGRDGEALCGIERALLQSGSSELLNWIVAAGILFPTRLSGGVVDYVPCYRSDAGTGTANGFVCWR